MRIKVLATTHHTTKSTVSSFLQITQTKCFKKIA